MALRTIPARRGAAAFLRTSQTIKIINTHGTQVIDTWAFATSSHPPAAIFPNGNSSERYSAVANRAASAPEFMSMAHTRAGLGRLTPRAGDALLSQRRARMLVLAADTSPGVHDTLIAACDRWRYAGLGHRGYHESCTDNCWDALEALADEMQREGRAEGAVVRALQAGLGGRVPDPLNLFMNIPVEGEGHRKTLSFEGPVGKAGDYVCLKAERDVVVVMSACPQDLVNINGSEGPKDAHFQVL